MGRPPPPTLASAAQATNLQAPSSQGPQQDQLSEGGLQHLTAASAITRSRSIGVQSTLDPFTQWDEGALCHGNSSAPSILHQWKRQQLIDEPWNAVSSASSSHRASKNASAIAETLQHLHVLASDHRECGGRRFTDKESGGDTKRTPSTKADGQARRLVNESGRRCVTKRPYASNAPRLKHGQIMFNSKVSSYFVCFCCKARALAFRSVGRALPSQPCQFVQDERTCRRDCADRHISPNNAENDLGHISLQQYQGLNGVAYQSARNCARRLGLRERAKEEFLWREGFIFLYPALKSLKNLLNPFGYEDPSLDNSTLCALVTERVQRQPQLLRPLAIEIRGRAGHGSLTGPALVTPNTLPSIHTSRTTSSRVPVSLTGQAQAQVLEYPPRSHLHAVTGGAVTLDRSASEHTTPGSAISLQLSNFQQCEVSIHGILHPAQKSTFGSYISQGRMWIPSLDQNQHPPTSTQTLAYPHSQMAQSVLPRNLDSPTAYDQVSPDYAMSHVGMNCQMLLHGMADQSMLWQYQTSAGPWTPIPTPRQVQRTDSSQSTGLRTRSSHYLATPSLQYDSSSARTDRSMLGYPRTPGAPVSPSPQNGHPGLLSGLAVPPECIDPKLLHRNHEPWDLIDDVELSRAH